MIIFISAFFSWLFQRRHSYSCAGQAKSLVFMNQHNATHTTSRDFLPMMARRIAQKSQSTDTG
jgi:hypothetical protein